MMKVNKGELLRDCQLMGLDEFYIYMVLRGKISIELAKELQDKDYDWCCDGLGCDECIPF